MDNACDEFIYTNFEKRPKRKLSLQILKRQPLMYNEMIAI